MLSFRSYGFGELAAKGHQQVDGLGNRPPSQKAEDADWPNRSIFITETEDVLVAKHKVLVVFFFFFFRLF